jgi:GT2 family glycosyltransferase
LFTWEVIVIDNQSADDQLPLFSKDFTEFLFVENEGNFGFSNGCNLGAKQSTGEYLLFLNPDTLVTLDALQNLLRISQEHAELTILSCSQFTDGGKDDRPYGLFLTPKTLTSLLRTIYRKTQKGFDQETFNSGDEVIFPDWVSGSVILISRNKFNWLGGWSEDFWMYYEDADLCKRVWKSGGSVALAQNIKITHNHGGASRINPEVKALTKSEVLISRHVYIHKHFSGLTRVLMQSYLTMNNLFLEHLVLAVLGLVLFFIPSLLSYSKLYVRIVEYYYQALMQGTWTSPRSVNYNMQSVSGGDGK